MLISRFISNYVGNTVVAINYSWYMTGDWKGFLTCNRQAGNVYVALRSLARSLLLSECVAVRKIYWGWGELRHKICQFSLVHTLSADKYLASYAPIKFSVLLVYACWSSCKVLSIVLFQYIFETSMS